eukprot:XP_001704775.1 Hypothetical protein GL50803_36327 [Giardia lamblia ATCC 50803]
MDLITYLNPYAVYLAINFFVGLIIISAQGLAHAQLCRQVQMATHANWQHRL